MFFIILAAFVLLVILSALKVSGDCSRDEEEREWKNGL